MTRNRLGPLFGLRRVDARGQRLDHVIGAEVEEERHRVARAIGRFPARIHHPVRGRAQLAVGQPVEHVADIDHQRPLGRRNRFPFTLRGQQFQQRLASQEAQTDKRIDSAMQRELLKQRGQNNG